MTGKELYDADLAKHPLYHDGTKRPSWENLWPVAQWSWDRCPDDFQEKLDAIMKKGV